MFIWPHLQTKVGRAAIDPSVALTYASGSGSGPFGLGWSIDVPGIHRRTDIGVPWYVDPIDDESPDSDVFVMGGVLKAGQLEVAPLQSYFRVGD